MTNKYFNDTGIKNDKRQPIIAEKYYSGFALAHDTYKAISAASDGKIYYVLFSQSIDTGGKVSRYDPVTNRRKFLQSPSGTSRSI